MKPPFAARRLSASDRRAVVLGGVLLLGAWLATRAVPDGLRAHASERARTEAAVHELAQARVLLAAEPVLRESLGVRAARLVAWAPRLVAGTTRTEAAAELAGLVSGLAAGHRVRLTRLDPLPDTTAGMFVRVGVHAEAAGDARGIAEWLAALESGRQLIEVRELEISAAEPAASVGQAETLRAQLVVTGWSAPPTAGRR